MSDFQIIEPADWPRVRDTLPSVDFLLDPLIPAGCQTFVHGPPGCGKSAFAWGAANAITRGEPYLGLATTKAACLLVSTDMNLYEYKLRWGKDAFKPDFPFVCISKCCIARPAFRRSPAFREIQAYVSKNGISTVFFDALGGLHAGLSARDDETATLVDAALSEWLPGVGKVLLGHDKKVLKNVDGAGNEPGEEDFLGSQMWLANITSQVHMWKGGRHLSVLRHGKSRVITPLAHDIRLYIDLEGRAELWNERRAQDVIQKTNVALRGLKDLTPSEQAGYLVKTYGISERTAWRWLSLTKG